MIKVLIVEDHPLVIEGLVKSFGNISDIEITGSAKSGKECLDSLSTLIPDIILMDLKLPDINGIELTKAILEKIPNPQIIVLSTHQQKYYIQSMLELGVRAYLIKSATFDEILKAVYTVYAGGTYFCEDIEAQLAEDKDNPVFLTKREKEVLNLIAKGLTNQEIADQLFISPLTVDSHRKNLILKFGAKNTASMINAAIIQGFLSSE